MKISKNSNSKPNRQNNNGNQNEARTNPRFKYPNSQPHRLIPTPTQDDEKTSKPKNTVKFSDKPIKINRELSQTRGPKTKQPKFHNRGTRRSPRFSRQNLTLTTGIDWITFGYFIYTLGSIFLSNVPVLELTSKISQEMLKLIENLVEVQAEEIPDIDESTSANNFNSIIIL